MDEIDEVTPLHFLEAVYCNPDLPLNTRMRAAIEAAPYKHPKLSAAAVGHFEGKSFADALEKAIERSGVNRPVLPPPKVIEHEPPMEISAETMKKPLQDLIGGSFEGAQVGGAPLIPAMTDDREYLLEPTEMDIEGTYFDPAYFLRWIEAKQVGLWFWEHEAYWDQYAHKKSRPHCWGRLSLYLRLHICACA